MANKSNVVEAIMNRPNGHSNMAIGQQGGVEWRTNSDESASANDSRHHGYNVGEWRQAATLSRVLNECHKSPDESMERTVELLSNEQYGSSEQDVHYSQVEMDQRIGRLKDYVDQRGL